ncbi:lipid asymmetry maintenance protein MlaB [Ideonella sp. A 288]|uniref:STAS domain-containing protein n=1 Tax=Ideonella sp. A 288 TaxID=1962181 RepID=UPI000B4BC289|nr:STAS domain-containing protein [Ideonella sp. A 288]
MLALPAVLTMSEARETLAQLGTALAADAAPEIDASGLQSLDTAAVAVLLEIQRQARAAGKPLRITGAPPKLGELARLYGVEALLGLA